MSVALLSETSWMHEQCTIASAMIGQQIIVGRNLAQYVNEVTPKVSEVEMFVCDDVLLPMVHKFVVNWDPGLFHLREIPVIVKSETFVTRALLDKVSPILNVVKTLNCSDHWDDFLEPEKMPRELQRTFKAVAAASRNRPVTQETFQIAFVERLVTELEISDARKRIDGLRSTRITPLPA